ncbi:MAG: TAXI family TRAP transporter solute-binding subunit [Chloroflexi bacterium]|nr:TAXI family TRAP transporter solute-binding subunit [Chloroflexota bacterium]
MRGLSFTVAVVLLASALTLACGGGSAAPAQPAQPAAEPKPAAETKPAAEAKPAAAAKPAAETKPAVEAKPAAETKPAAPVPQATAAGAAAPSPDGRRIVFGTSQLSSVYGVYTAAVVNLLNKSVPGVSLTLREEGGPINNLRRARAGEVDLALGSELIVYKASVGDLKGWENNPQSDVRGLWGFDPAAVAFVVSERSGVKTIPDLNGKAMSPGGQGTSNETLTVDVMEHLGIKPQWQRGGMTDMTEAFKDRRIVGYTKATPLTRPDPLIVESALAQPIRILSWPDELVKKAQAKYPYLKTVQIPAGVYQGDWNKEPITTWGFVTNIWTTTKLPEDLAYQFTKIVLQDKTEQVAAFPALKDVDLGKLTLEHAAVPFHKGALKAFRELGYNVPKELVATEAQ